MTPRRDRAARDLLSAPDRSCRSAARRAAARARPVEGEPAADALRAGARAIGQGRRRAPAPRRCSSQQRPDPVVRSARRSGAARRLDLLRPRPRRRRPPRRRPVARSARPANGRRRRRGSRASPRGGMNDCERRLARLPRGRCGSAASREFSAARPLLDGARGAGLPPPARGRSRLLRAAARSPESFYGLMARETLGMDKRLPDAARRATSAASKRLPNVRRATELVAIGERSAGRGDASPPGQDRHARRSSRADRASPTSSTSPARNSGSPTTASPARAVDAADRYPDAALDARQWLAGRSGAGLCPHHPGMRTSAPTRSARPARSG